MSWTDERIDTLKTMWEAGQTASQIAEALGGVSRNAVIGKAHRLGLQSRPSPVVSKEEARQQAAAAAQEAAGAATPETVAEPVEATPVETVVIPAPEPVIAAAPSAEAAPAPVAPVADAVADADGDTDAEEDIDEEEDAPVAAAPAPRERPVESQQPILRSVGPGGFVRQAPGEQQAPSTPAPPRRLVPARTAPEYADKTSLLDLSDKVCKWPLGHPGEPDFHFCGEKVNPGFPYCVTHCGHAYQAQLPRRDRRAPPLPFGGPRMR